MRGAAAEARGRGAETASCWFLAIGAVAAPLALGAAGTSTKFMLEAGITVAVVLWALSGRRSGVLAAMPVAVAGLACLQVLPLPARILAVIAPASAAAWGVMKPEAASHWATISFDPHATLASIRPLLLGLATVITVIGLGTVERYRRILFGAAAVAGLCILGVGVLAGRPGDETMLMGLVKRQGPLRPGDDPRLTPRETGGGATTYIHKVAGHGYDADAGQTTLGVGTYFYDNHFAAAVVMTLPFVLVLRPLVIRSRRRDGAAPGSMLRWGVPLGVSAIAFWAVMGLASSRAGGLSLVIAMTTLLAIVLPSGWPRRAAAWTLAVECIAAAAFAAILLVGSFNVFAWLPGFLRSAAESQGSNTRGALTRLAFQMCGGSPLFGSGLGTFRQVGPTANGGLVVLSYAHNEYAQLLAEAGLAGAVVAAVLAAAIVFQAVTFLTAARGRSRWLNAAPWAALAGIAVHAWFDWNLHLPGNAFLACLVAGLAISSVPWRESPSYQAAEWFPPACVSGFGLSAACVVALAFQARDAMAEHSIWGLQDAIIRARLHRQDPDSVAAAAPALERAMQTGERTARWDPRNPALLAALSRASLHLAAERGDDSDEGPLGQSRAWAREARRWSPLARGIPSPLSASSSSPRPIPR